MAHKRDYFRFYFAYLEHTQGLTNSEIGRLITGLLNYSAYGVIPNNMGNEAKAFFKIKAGIDHDRYIEEGRAQYGSKGEFHPNWKGGITSQNQVGRSSKEYYHWRTAVFSRDNYTCQRCGRRGGKLNAHHIKKWSEFKSLRFDVNNGITLCDKCHREEHRRR